MASARPPKRTKNRQSSTDNTSKPLHTYDEALQWLQGHYNLEQHLGRDETTPPSLERMNLLMELLGNPQRDIPAIHITGTNGKGSTSRMLVELIGATGLDVGSYTSPHIDRVNDRITIANEPLDDESMTLALSEIAQVEPWVIQATGQPPSYFEVLCAAAYNWFAATAVDVNVIEVGMGGRWDATNVIDAQVAVITNIGSDHLEIIGPTLTDVAKEKAGIISNDTHVICGETSPDLIDVIAHGPHRELWQRHLDFDVSEDHLAVGGRLVNFSTPHGHHNEIFLPVNGAHQSRNASTAIAAAEAFFGQQLNPDLISEAFAQLTLPARFEIVQRHPTVIIDGAHNPPAASVVSETLFHDFATEERPVLVIGANRPRDPLQLLDALNGKQYSRIIATAANWARAMPANELGNALEGNGTAIEVVPQVSDAVARAIEIAGETGIVLITGSLYVASEARSQLADTSR
ncbi:MAG: folylpolyglutamate synthase/dihydrofolate synthase family protein [Actinomycetota bacterium]|nr:folylpolyglutamate synthase/dihydrofolate synthase family protein [Actinomycetota bacterium]MEE3256691.1 folylpolyglutamate synthase/dihydrofolate synthase family protein [Actinomycetota bacterium]